MILVDTSVWIDHLHNSEPSLVNALEHSDVVAHPMVIGELALGTLRRRGTLLELLANLPKAEVANHEEVMLLVERHRLYGQGLSLVDAHLIASVFLSTDTRLWTRDKRLSAAAQALKIPAHQE